MKNKIERLYNEIEKEKEQIIEIFDDFYFSMLGYGLPRQNAWAAAKKYCSDHFFTKTYCKILGWEE